MALTHMDWQAVPSHQHVAQRHLLLKAAHHAVVARLCLAHHVPALDGLGRVVPLPLIGGDERHALRHDDATPGLPPLLTDREAGFSALMQVSALAAVLDEAVLENKDE